MIDINLIIKWLLICWPVTSVILTFLDNIKIPARLEILKCGKCLSFWITLAATSDFFGASAVSLLMMLIEKIQNKKTQL
jgi:hypothetical protein